MNKIILIKRYTPASRLLWQNLLKHKVIPDFSVEEIINKFQGYEGEVVEVYPIKENDLDLHEIIKLFYEITNLDNHLLLYVSTESRGVPNVIKEQAVFVGFDAGLCDEEGNIFSSIFHEILFGKVPELVLFVDRLNENFLLPDRSTAEKYVEIHNAISAQGRDVEDFMSMVIYEIWKYK